MLNNDPSFPLQTLKSPADQAHRAVLPAWQTDGHLRGFRLPPWPIYLAVGSSSTRMSTVIQSSPGSSATPCVKPLISLGEKGLYKLVFPAKYSKVFENYSTNLIDALHVLYKEREGPYQKKKCYVCINV
jgi:hypothetical protein